MGLMQDSPVSGLRVLMGRRSVRSQRMSVRMMTSLYRREPLGTGKDAPMPSREGQQPNSASQ